MSKKDLLKPINEMRKVVHISDIHITESNKSRIYEFFSFLASYYKDHETKPILVLSGDICEGNTTSTIQSVVEFSYEIQITTALKIFEEMENLGFEMYICPGNHDYPPNGDSNNIRMKLICDDFFKKFYDVDKISYPIVKKSGKYAFFIMDSNEGEFDETNKDFSDGSFGDNQLNSFKHKISKIPSDTIIFVVMHHHPLNIIPLYLLSDGKKLFNIIKTYNKKAKNSVIMLFGHLHKSAKKFCKKKYGVKVAISSQSSTAKNRCNFFNFIEITPNQKRDNPDKVKHITAKIQNENFGKINENFIYEINSIFDVKKYTGFLPSVNCAKYCCCGYF